MNSHDVLEIRGAIYSVWIAVGTLATLVGVLFWDVAESPMSTVLSALFAGIGIYIVLTNSYRIRRLKSDGTHMTSGR